MPHQDVPTTPSRRQVLCGLAVALLAPGALAACSSESGGGSTPTPGGSTSGQSGGALAKLADVPVGSGKLVDDASGKKILLVRTSENEVKAYDPTCTHAGTTVNPPKSGVITCPNHGSQFDASSGSVKKGPASAPLKTVSVKIQGDSIVAA